MAELESPAGAVDHSPLEVTVLPAFSPLCPACWPFRLMLRLGLVCDTCPHSGRGNGNGPVPGPWASSGNRSVGRRLLVLSVHRETGCGARPRSLRAALCLADPGDLGLLTLPTPNP